MKVNNTDSIRSVTFLNFVSVNKKNPSLMVKEFFLFV
jgi:hypothetical protein